MRSDERIHSNKLADAKTEIDVNAGPPRRLVHRFEFLKDATEASTAATNVAPAGPSNMADKKTRMSLGVITAGVPGIRIGHRLATQTSAASAINPIPLVRSN